MVERVNNVRRRNKTRGRHKTNRKRNRKRNQNSLNTLKRKKISSKRRTQKRKYGGKRTLKKKMRGGGWYDYNESNDFDNLKRTTGANLGYLGTRFDKDINIAENIYNSASTGKPWDDFLECNNDIYQNIYQNKLNNSMPLSGNCSEDELYKDETLNPVRPSMINKATPDEQIREKLDNINDENKVWLPIGNINTLLPGVSKMLFSFEQNDNFKGEQIFHRYYGLGEIVHYSWKGWFVRFYNSAFRNKVYTFFIAKNWWLKHNILIKQPRSYKIKQLYERKKRGESVDDELYNLIKDYPYNKDELFDKVLKESPDKKVSQMTDTEFSDALIKKLPYKLTEIGVEIIIKKTLENVEELSEIPSDNKSVYITKWEKIWFSDIKGMINIKALKSIRGGGRVFDTVKRFMKKGFDPRESFVEENVSDAWVWAGEALDIGQDGNPLGMLGAAILNLFLFIPIQVSVRLGISLIFLVPWLITWLITPFFADDRPRHAQEESSQSSASHQGEKSSQSSAYHQVYSDKENNLNHYLLEVSKGTVSLKGTIVNEAEDVYRKIIELKRNINNPISKSLDDMEKNYTLIIKYISSRKLDDYDKKVIFNTYLNDSLIKYYEKKSPGYPLPQLKERKEILDSEFNRLTKIHNRHDRETSPPAGQKPPAKPRAQPPAKSRAQPPPSQQVTQPKQRRAQYPAGPTKYIDNRGNEIKIDDYVKFISKTHEEIPEGAVGIVTELRTKNKEGKHSRRVKVLFKGYKRSWNVPPEKLEHLPPEELEHY